MKQKRKIILYSLIVVVAIMAYLFLAHFLIFYRLQTAGPITFNRPDVYIAQENKTMAKNLSYAALGDSLTAGAGVAKYEESYPYLLAEELAAGGKNKITLKNFSYPGARTSNLIKDFLTPAVASQPELITLFIGVNDVFGNVSRATFKENYQTILDRLTKETKAKIYLIGLPYLGLPKLLLAPYNYYYHWRTGEFNDIIRGLAKVYNLEYIDLAATSPEFNKNQVNYSKDLFHPSALGYKLWAKIIYDAINQ